MSFFIRSLYVQGQKGTDRHNTARRHPLNFFLGRDTLVGFLRIVREKQPGNNRESESHSGKSRVMYLTSKADTGKTTSLTTEDALQSQTSGQEISMAVSLPSPNSCLHLCDKDSCGFLHPRLPLQGSGGCGANCDINRSLQPAGWCSALLDSASRTGHTQQWQQLRLAYNRCSFNTFEV